MNIWQTKLITLQLGAGCSATAVEGGPSVDTSMGFTLWRGVGMGTRSGHVDPSLAGFLARREEVSVEEAEDWLNTQSGLLGVSGRSSDMRELLETEARGNGNARPWTGRGDGGQDESTELTSTFYGMFMCAIES